MVKDDDARPHHHQETREGPPAGQDDHHHHRHPHRGPFHSKRRHGHHKQRHHRHHGPYHNDTACRMDFARLCPGVRGHKAIYDCLDTDKVKDLSPECREAQPCLEDSVRFCRGAEGPKEHHSCMLKHNTSLSPTCQAAMKERKRHRAQPMDDDEYSDQYEHDGEPQKGWHLGGLMMAVVAFFAVFACGICVGLRKARGQDNAPSNGTCKTIPDQAATNAVAPAEAFTASPPPYTAARKGNDEVPTAPPAGSLSAPLLKDNSQV